MFTNVREAAARRSRRECPTTTRPRNRPHLGVESLEDRQVPAILFAPAFGPESIAMNSTKDGLKSPVVNVIFHGAYWNGPNAAADKAIILSDFKSIVAGPYLSYLDQYGSDGKATINARTETTTAKISTAPLANLPFSLDELYQFVQAQIDNNAISAPGAQPAIYVVVTSPGGDADDMANAGGYNIPWPGLHTVWASTALDKTGHIDMDNITDIFSHELVETISDPDPSGIQVVLPPKLPKPLIPTGVLQIGDGEPDGARYDYRLGGLLVQAYWSDRDKYYVVPDGSRQNFTIKAEWDAKGNFAGKYDLTVAGDQFGANYPDSILIGTVVGAVAHPQTVVGENSDAVRFDAGQLASINVDTVGGSDWVSVDGLESQTTLNIQSTGKGSRDHVTVGDGDSMSAVLGTVNVANVSGTTSLEVTDANDTVAHPVKMTSSTSVYGTTATSLSTISYGGLGTINYQSGGTAGGTAGTSGVTAVRLDLPIGGYVDSLDVEGVSVFAPVTVVGRLFDSITGPASSKIKKILF